MNSYKHSTFDSVKLSGFTIIELLVVIVVIGILASVTLVSYNGISQKATAVALQSDLSTASKQIKLFQVTNGAFPVANDCPTPSALNICLKSSFDNSFAYTSNNSANPQTFNLMASHNNITYEVTESSSPSLSSENGTGDWKQVAAGNYHACAIDNNDLAYCWGKNGSGQLGNNSIVDSLSPQPVYTGGVLAGKRIKSIKAGGTHTCAVDTDGVVYCWGSGEEGQLGHNFMPTYSQIPVRVYTAGALGGRAVSSIALGFKHSCAIDSINKVYCWGYNPSAWYQVGDGTSYSRQVPTSVIGAVVGKNITSISSTSNGLGTCAVADGLAYCWGGNTSGSRGIGNTTPSSISTAVSTAGVMNGKTITAIAAGLSRACAIDSNSSVYCWGDNTSGGFGDGTTNSNSLPTAAGIGGVLDGKDLVSISAGSNHTCALDSGGLAYCWGTNTYGQLGNNTNNVTLVPVKVNMVGLLNNKVIDSISLGALYTCAHTTDSNVYCWGSNNSGRLGDVSTIDSLIPVKVVHP